MHLCVGQWTASRSVTGQGDSQSLFSLIAVANPSRMRTTVSNTYKAAPKVDKFQGHKFVTSSEKHEWVSSVTSFSLSSEEEKKIPCPLVIGVHRLFTLIICNHSLA